MFRPRGPRFEREGIATARAERAHVLRSPTEWPVGWAGFETPWPGRDPEEMETFAAAFDHELRRELTVGHVLHEEGFLAIGKREATDDVVFALDAGRIAVVHLTWAQTPEQPSWPRTSMYASFEEFLFALPEDFPEERASL